MLSIRLLGIATLGAAVLTGANPPNASARGCNDGFAPACEIATTVSEPASTEPAARTTRHRTARTSKRKKPRVATKRRQQTEENDEATLTGQDSIGLVALLPWWRANDEHIIRAAIEQVASPVLTTADAFVPEPATIVYTQLVDGVRIAAADEVNEIDLAATTSFAAATPGDNLNLAAVATEQPATEQPAAEQSWLQYLLALLGGVLAAGSAARFLFA